MEPKRRRSASGGKPEQLSERAKEARRAYQNTYRKNHPESVKRWNQQYWERRASRMEREPETGVIHED